jgi:hypothetical protein
MEAAVMVDHSPVGPASGRPDGQTSEADSDCLARSCLKWGQDGELSALDLQTILQRLSAVDEQATNLLNCPVDPA